MPSHPTHKQSAKKLLNALERFALIAILCSFVVLFIFNWHAALVLLVSILTILYFLDLIFNLSIVFKSSAAEPEIIISPEEITIERSWPRYTVFCPLYKEAHVLPQFIEAMQELDYPKDKLEILLVLEEDDVDTIEQARKMKLPQSFEIVVVPHSLPKTKP